MKILPLLKRKTTKRMKLLARRTTATLSKASPRVPSSACCTIFSSLLHTTNDPFRSIYFGAKNDYSTTAQETSKGAIGKPKHRTQVVTRFAPSPTGFMHLGALRTALYNYLLARQKGGTFLLRIEDTDQKRLVPGSVEQIKDTLQWAGLEFDQFEVQSQRTSIYHKHAHEMIKNGHAYKCYCKEERLAWLRDKGQKYDRHCLSLSQEEIERLESENAPFTVRMKIPTSPTEKLYTVVDDVIFGSMKFENALLDDQILLKSDGHPTYHLANVVDDFEMKVSHVIRGVEWLSSTPKHVILYDMLFPDQERPVFAHLPLLVDETGAKLSKRKDHASIDWYRNNGILREALINFVALLGWNKGQGSDKDLWNISELIQDFSLEQVNKGNSCVNMQKLNWINAQFTKKLVVEHPEQAQQLALSSLEQFLSPEEYQRVQNSTNKEFLQKVLTLVGDRLGNMQRFGELCWYFFSDLKFVDNTANSIVTSRDALSQTFDNDLQKQVSQELINQFESLSEFNVEQINAILNAMKQQMKQKVNYKDIVTFIRLSCTGEKVGASIAQTLELLGKDKVISRMRRSLDLLNSQ